MEKEDLGLIYVQHVGTGESGKYEYDFYFSENPDSAWGEDWNEQCPSACENLQPADDTYCLVERLVCDIPFYCAQENSCFSMSDMTSGILACCFEDISEYEEYPEPYRIVFPFADKYSDVIEQLKSREIAFEEKKEEPF